VAISLMRFLTLPHLHCIISIGGREKLFGRNLLNGYASVFWNCVHLLKRYVTGTDAGGIELPVITEKMKKRREQKFSMTASSSTPASSRVSIASSTKDKGSKSKLSICSKKTLQ